VGGSDKLAECFCLIHVRVWGQGLCGSVCGCRCVCVCVVVESLFRGAFGMHENFLHCVDGGGVLVYSKLNRI
jgi:hypothetical protein